MDGEIYKPKIDGAEAFLMVGLCLAFDAFDIFATFLDGFFGAGEILKFFNNIVASATLLLWAMMKEVRALWTLAGGGLELIPVVNALPIRTATMVATIWLDWHPQQAELAETVLPKIKNPKRILGKKPNTTQAV